MEQIEHELIDELTGEIITSVIATTGLDDEKAKYLIAQFEEFQFIASEWNAKAKSIVVVDEAQTDLMAEARKGRLFLKSKRVEVEKTRKHLKESCLKEGQAIDGIAKKLKLMIEPIENHLLNQENYIKIKEEKRIEGRYQERLFGIGAICPDVDPSVYDIRGMSDDGFNALIDTLTETARLKAGEVDRLEKERIAKEKAETEERERVRVENEKLRKEAVAREKELAEARRLEDEATAKLEAERKKTEEAERREKETTATQAKTVLSVTQQLEIARKAITNIHRSTDDGCLSCMEIKKIAESGIKQIGGWLE